MIDNYLFCLSVRCVCAILRPCLCNGIFQWRLLPFHTNRRTRSATCLASVLGSAVNYGLLVKNPWRECSCHRQDGKRKKKPHITPEQFDELVNEIPEPYATMVYVAMYTGLRVSELVGAQVE